MENKIERASAGSRITLILNVTGREVLVDRIEDLPMPHGIVAKTQIDGKLRDLASLMRAKGVSPQASESVLHGVITNRAFDLSSLCDFLDSACIYCESLAQPEAWIGPIARKVAPLEPGMKRSLETCRLFEEARNAQGTEREPILLKSLEA